MRVECRDVVVTYQQGKTSHRVLNKINLTMDEGATAITGPSGAGKSTLLRVIAGEQKCDSGVVLFGAAGNADRDVAFIHQDYRLVPFLDVRENLLLAAESRGITLSDVGELLERVGLPTTYARRMPGTLSGGEQQRVAIARSLGVEASVLVADEPTGALDEENSAAIAQLLAELAETTHRTVVVATHDPIVYRSMHHRYDLRHGHLQTEPGESASGSGGTLGPDRSSTSGISGTSGTSGV